MKIKGPALAVKRIWESKGVDSEWVAKNCLILNTAIKGGLALCGSAGVGVATAYPQGEPKDLDFVTESSEDAWKFISKIEEYLRGKSTYYRLLVNHKTKFCPEFTRSHYRIICPFWKEICVFVLDSDQIKLDYFYRDGVKVQNYRQMYDAKKEMDQRKNEAPAPVEIDSPFPENDIPEQGDLEPKVAVKLNFDVDFEEGNPYPNARG